MVDYILGVAKAQLAKEKEFWDEIVTEREVEEQESEEVSEEPVPTLL